jgi:hypothetical protein
MAGYTNTNAFVSQTLTHLDRKNVGGNSALNTTSTIKGSFSAGYGQFTYDSNPNVSINNDAVATVENTNHSILNCVKKIQTSWHATAGLRFGN